MIWMSLPAGLDTPVFGAVWRYDPAELGIALDYPITKDLRNLFLKVPGAKGLH